METGKIMIRIIDLFPLNHDVKCIRTVKPDGIEFTPGQATELFVDKDGWEDDGRPFTFTNLPEDEYLEFMIKEYPDHGGVTQQIHSLQKGDALFMKDVFGAIAYKGSGLFIAGGAGATPFISILRSLHQQERAIDNTMLFGNKTMDDIFLESELAGMLKDNIVHILSDEKTDAHLHGNITREIIADSISDPQGKFYLCGPPPMMEAVEYSLKELEIREDQIIKEDF